MKTAAEHLDELREQLNQSLSINMAGAYDIFKHYGVQKQLEKLSEECRELDMAAMTALIDVIHMNVVEQSHVDNLIEEMTDVYVMIYQVMRWFGAEDKMRQIAAEKIERTHKRIAEEKRRADND